LVDDLLLRVDGNHHHTPYKQSYLETRTYLRGACEHPTEWLTLIILDCCVP